MSKTCKYMGRHSLVKRLSAQVGSKGMAIAILKKRGDLNRFGKLTAKGRRRDNMTARERSIDRASKASGRPRSRYGYNRRTNNAVLRRKGA